MFLEIKNMIAEMKNSTAAVEDKNLGDFPESRTKTERNQERLRKCGSCPGGPLCEAKGFQNEKAGGRKQ